MQMKRLEQKPSELQETQQEGGVKFKTLKFTAAPPGGGTLPAPGGLHCTNVSER